MPQQLTSFPGPKTGRGYSAVVLDHSHVPPSSPSLFCTGMLDRACEQSCNSLDLRSCTSSTPCFLFCPGLTQPVLFLLCCFNSAACCQVRFYISLLGSSVICGVLHASLREHNCAISMTPEGSLTPEASLHELPYQLPLRFILGT